MNLDLIRFLQKQREAWEHVESAAQALDDVIEKLKAKQVIQEPVKRLVKRGAYWITQDPETGKEYPNDRYSPDGLAHFLSLGIRDGVILELYVPEDNKD